MPVQADPCNRLVRRRPIPGWHHRSQRVNDKPIPVRIPPDDPPEGYELVPGESTGSPAALARSLSKLSKVDILGGCALRHSASRCAATKRRPTSAARHRLKLVLPALLGACQHREAWGV
jgi:hypothetical protein